MLSGTRRLGGGIGVVGAGMSRFGAFKDKASRDLFVDAFVDMQKSVDKGLDITDIQSIFVGNFSSDLFEGQGHLAPMMAEWVGLNPCPATRVEDACASGGVALRQGVLAIASGLYDVVLVGGVEKMTNLPTERVTDALAAASDVLYEASAGFTFPGLYAAMATAYMDKYGLGTEPFMHVAIKNHKNGGLNPKAQFNTSLKDLLEARKVRARDRGQPVPEWKTEMDFLNDPAANPLVAWPMRLFDCSPITDGAACLLLVAEEIAGNFTDRPLRLIGSGQGSDSSLLTRPDITTIGSARVAARQAYDMAGVAPSDIKIAEVHDCFTIAELIATEDLGFFAPGEGAKAALEGRTARDGERPINTSGGLKSKGHPVGASGVGQVVEIWHQMRGEAGDRQLRDRDINLALAHNVGGTGNTCVVHIFERR
ncbi:MAG: beta-ketoacyl synthase N-terminal-like domain-containing protein [Dehalococcoidia bacterium]|nr:beta-ketoacyl synthase N-terminal-like domain-containing protein [Dehalococcoidia bacterium]